MILTLLSMLGGGFMRLLPELIGLWNKKTDNSHELAMVDKQIALAQFKGQDDRQTIAMQGDISMNLALLDANKEALKGQMQITGIWIVDVLNFLVRPSTTYYFLFWYGMVKLAMLVIAFQTTDPWHAILQCWTDRDDAILSGILAFWFVGRVFDKQK